MFLEAEYAKTAIRLIIKIGLAIGKFKFEWMKNIKKNIEINNPIK